MSCPQCFQRFLRVFAPNLLVHSRARCFSHTVRRATSNRQPIHSISFSQSDARVKTNTPISQDSPRQRSGLMRRNFDSRSSRPIRPSVYESTSRLSGTRAQDSTSGSRASPPFPVNTRYATQDSAATRRTREYLRGPKNSSTWSSEPRHGQKPNRKNDSESIHTSGLLLGSNKSKPKEALNQSTRGGFKNKDQAFRPSMNMEPKERQPWQVQKAALEKKFGDSGWSPRKRLSPDALDGIRTLHTQNPREYTTEVLAEHFRVSAEAIRRILKSKWRPSEEEEMDRRSRWSKRGEGIWNQMAELGLRKPNKKWKGGESNDSSPEARKYAQGIRESYDPLL